MNFLMMKAKWTIQQYTVRVHVRVMKKQPNQVHVNVDGALVLWISRVIEGKAIPVTGREGP
jgi:hypothetical protein